MSASLFEEFRRRLAVRNSEDIATSYAEVTKRLNKDFWGSSSSEAHSLQVGSYGRRTAIHGVSDLDMVFELPPAVYDRISKVKINGQSQLLQEVRASLRERYPRTDIKADGQVVVVSFEAYVVEVLPAFLMVDGGYTFGDSNDGGSWKECRPRKEMSAVDAMNARTNGNLKHVCKMLRAWKNEHGAPLSGMLLDTLVYKFFRDNGTYDSQSYGAYPKLLTEVFRYIADQPENEFWIAPGSEQHVKKTGYFQGKAKKAFNSCRDALGESSTSRQERHWRKVFGHEFPSLMKAATPAPKTTSPTEQFIEDLYPVDIKYSVAIDAQVKNKETVESLLLEMLSAWLPVGRGLRFFIQPGSCTVPKPYQVFWKVRNVGDRAEALKQTRGQIVEDEGKEERIEHTKFAGPHYVECYVVKDGVCVARDEIDVPIHED